MGECAPKNPKRGVNKHFQAKLLKTETHISRPRFERLQRNFTSRCSSTLLTVTNVKNFKFRKSIMAAAAILKNRKINISRLQFKRFRRNLAQYLCISTFLTFWTVKNLKFLKSNMAAAAILQNRKI